LIDLFLAGEVVSPVDLHAWATSRRWTAADAVMLGEYAIIVDAVLEEVGLMP
jgi:hypothetical protein